MYANLVWLRRILSQNYFLSGKSAVAPAGLALAAILLMAIGGSTWWDRTMRTALLKQIRHEHVQSTGELLARSTEAMLMENELSSVRTLVIEIARQANLEDCQIVLHDGHVIAHADPTKVSPRNLPAQWPAGTPQIEGVTLREGQIHWRYNLTIPGQGTAKLLITAGQDIDIYSTWKDFIGTALILIATFIGLVWVYRRMRDRLRLLGELSKVLRAMQAGEQSLEALRLRNSFGKEAETWNRLLTESQKVRNDAIAEHARRSMGTERRSTGGLIAAVDMIPQGLLLTDAKAHIIYANGAAANFLQVPVDNIVGSPIDVLIDHSQVIQLARSISIGSTKRRGAIECERKTEDGGHRSILRFSIRPIRADSPATAMVIIEDISQQRVAEDARHSFVAQATHELRTPLTNIRLSAETMMDGVDNQQIYSTSVNVINQESQRLERIVSEMLSVTEIESGAISLSKDNLPLESMFNNLRADYQSQAEEKKIELVFEVPPKLPHMEGDRDKILLALHNLIGNALKYTPDGNQVTVIVATQKQHLEICVSDTGIGISDEDAENIFEKFYRAKDKRVNQITGSGLGLALAREVIRLHGGDITVKSELNQGSSFTITLPVLNQAA